MTRANSRSWRFAACLSLIMATGLPLTGAGQSVATAQDGCLPGDRGYFQARLRGAIQAQIDWRGAALSCQGGARAADRGVRLSLSGMLPDSQQRLRIIIGFAVPPAGSVAAATPANVTVIVEGANRVYATQGEGRCAVEALRQDELPRALIRSAVDAASQPRRYRVAARGYCIDPVPGMSTDSNAGTDRLYIDRFDFAALASFEPESMHAASSAP